MGWDNTTEMTATVVDSVNYLARLFYNANSKEPNREPVKRVPRPFEKKPEPKTVSLSEFNNIVKGS